MLAFVGSLAIAIALAWLVAFAVFSIAALRGVERFLACMPWGIAAFILTFGLVLWGLHP
ncbi:hypothetical protein [Pararhodobacter marinus]|uniref:hypothetical protein n=1 Tax=Pararhodobacter marinus TaxID=2184063 RepID=UPI0035196106